MISIGLYFPQMPFTNSSSSTPLYLFPGTAWALLCVSLVVLESISWELVDTLIEGWVASTFFSHGACRHSGYFKIPPMRRTTA